jgi:hypothetical protein
LDPSSKRQFKVRRRVITVSGACVRQAGNERREPLNVRATVPDLFGKAVDRVLVAAPALGKVGEDLLPILAGRAAPSAGWVDLMGLHIKDELVAG